MAEINTEIANLESILTNFWDEHTESELQCFEKKLADLNNIQNLWYEFGDIPMDPKTECIEAPFVAHDKYGNTLCIFPAGTYREDIWEWFETEFHISVAEDLMY